jgi:hypothetical protein
MGKGNIRSRGIVRTRAREGSRVTRDRAALEHWMIGVVAAMASAPAGCGGSDNSIEHDPGFVRPACLAGDVHQWLQGMTLPVGTDYMKFQGDSATPLELGTPCATAKDAPACMTALASAPSSPAPGTGAPFGACLDVCPQVNLIETRGDVVSVASNAEQIRQGLVPIDDAAKAMLLVEMSGFDVSCTQGGAAPVSGGWLVMALTYQGCNGRTRHIVKVGTDGRLHNVSSQVLQEASSNCVVGRRPPRLRPSLDRRARTALGAYFSEMATLEAASVHAFVRIQAELALHGAPAALVRAARRAAHDEVRHARGTARLARKYGARAARPRIAPAPLRSLADVVIDNEAEGCVRETFGALFATYQAARARDPDVAQALQQIAADECAHATLAWDIARWSMARISGSDRARVRESRKKAVATLSREIESQPSASLVAIAGIPSRSAARILYDAAQQVLWSS